jgi:hypothetical protein
MPLERKAKPVKAHVSSPQFNVFMVMFAVVSPETKPIPTLSNDLAKWAKWKQAI